MGPCRRIAEAAHNGLGGLMFCRVAGKGEDGWSVHFYKGAGPGASRGSASGNGVSTSRRYCGSNRSRDNSCTLA